MKRPDNPPERVVTAVESLDVQPDDQIMEIGCGRGVAAALIVGRLADGRLLAIDRSEKAIAAAAARNAEAAAAGKARFVTSALEDLDPDAVESYDKVLAVNVNLFWVREALRELRLIAGLLRPGGRLWLWYDPPGPDRLARLETALGENLERAGYRWTIRTSGGFLGVEAQPQVSA